MKNSLELFQAIINAPSIEAALELYFRSVADDERKRVLRKAAALRTQRQRTIRVPDRENRRTRNLVVDVIQVDDLVSPNFKARLEGRLEDNGKRASIYLLKSGFFGPLNIFK